MKCAACGHDNREQAKFCEECATRLARICAACGTEARTGAKFCDECGGALEVADATPTPRDPRIYTPKHLAERILTTRSAIEGERKHVTVLFVDCVGFTSIAEQLDPEEIHGIMDRCFERILKQVHHFEGTVNQFTGDGVMALFGAPVALEDAPRRAVMAALGIQRALEPLHDELRAARNIDFRMRIGINSGPVVVGKIGNDLRMDYTAVGDTTNLAARLQSLATPGSILISEATYRLVSGFFETRDLGLLNVKGKAAPVHAYEVIAELPQRGALDALAESGLTPLVGRQRELDTLLETFRTARQGRGQVVFLVGEAGIGKSRLLYEFRHAIGGEAVAWIEGRCASFGTSTAFLPIIDALRRFFGIDDRDAEATALAKVEQGLQRIGNDVGWTAPFIGQLLSLPVADPAIAAMDAATRRSEIFRALKTLTLQAARSAPLVVLIEDLHWIDPASEEFLTFLADAVPGTSSLLICSYRAGYRHPFGDRSYHTRISLPPLSTAEMENMTGALLGCETMPDELRGIISGKADGNPFFVEEVTRSLVEEGILQRVAGAVTLTRPLESIAVPDRIHDVIMARIDRLRDDRKQAIQIASVIGREFAMRLLERIIEVGDRASELVAELRALELVYEKTVHPELAYMFKHALTHDVAYDSILLQRRRVLHRTIGLAIEELYADRLVEHYETLAHHFTRGEDWQRALLYHERAAEKSAEAFASQAVIDHCRAAAEIADRLGDVSARRRQEIEERLGLAALYMSRFADAGDAFGRAAQWSTEMQSRGVNLGNASHSYLWGHDYAAAKRLADQVVQLGREQQLAAVEGLGICHQSVFKLIGEGDMQPCRAGLEQALSLLESSGNGEAIAFVRFWQMSIAEWSGDYRRAVDLGSQIIPQGRLSRLAHLVIWPGWFIGKAECCLGNYRNAIGKLSEAHEITDRIGDRAWKTRILNTLGWCLGEIGCHERARTYNEAAALIAHDIGSDEIIHNAEINLAGNYLALGDVDRAAEYLQPLYARMQLCQPFMLWRYSMHLFDALGCLALASGDPQRALSFADDELARAQKHQATKLVARALELRARALLLLDRRDETEAVLQQIFTLAARIDYPRAQWRALALLAETHRRRGRTSTASEYSARSAQVVESLAHALNDSELQTSLRRQAATFGC